MTLVSISKKYYTLAKPALYEEIIKGSRFIAHLTSVNDETAAKDWIANVSHRYSDATHNCWAYRIDGVYRFSDDGEPAGTAGRPMLEVLQKREIDHAVGLVTRYYGGTKLGAGGLIRAYGGTLAKGLDIAEVIEIKPRTQASIHVPFTEMDALHRLLDEWQDLNKLEPNFDINGMIVMVDILAEDLQRFCKTINNLSKGKAIIEVLEPSI